MPGRRAREAMPGRNVMLESTSGTCALELETGTNHFLVAARVEFGTGNRHVPFFRSCPRGVPRGVPVPQVRVPGKFAEILDSGPQDNWKKFAEVVGLDDNLDIFFCWEESRPWRGLGRAQVGHGGVALAFFADSHCLRNC